MKGVKGKFLKKLKSSIKPINGYLKQEYRVLQVNASDGFVETFLKNPFQKSHQTQLVPKEEEVEEVQEKVKDCKNLVQEPDIIDVAELMRDLEDEEEEEEMEVDDVLDDKENMVPPPLKGNEDSLKMEKKSGGALKAAPLSEINISSFRRPDLDSGTLFDPNLLAAFEQAVKEHMRMSEVERQVVTERENLERRKSGTESRILQEKVESSGESNPELCEQEPPTKTRRIEEENPLSAFEEKCPAGGSDSVIFYTTSLRGIRKTFEDCNSIRFLLESFRVTFFERDVSMHAEFKEELWRVLDDKAMPPRLFIKGRYIGGAEEVLALHEQGKLRVLFEGIPIDQSNSPCEGCAGFRFVLCFNCNGSHRVMSEDGLSSKCQNCNENGLIICPLCC